MTSGKVIVLIILFIYYLMTPKASKRVQGLFQLLYRCLLPGIQTWECI